MRGCATLMGASEVTSEAKGWEGEIPCDFGGDEVTSLTKGGLIRHWPNLGAIDRGGRVPHVLSRILKTPLAHVLVPNRRKDHVFCQF